MDTNGGTAWPQPRESREVFSGRADPPPCYDISEGGGASATSSDLRPAPGYAPIYPPLPAPGDVASATAGTAHPSLPPATTDSEPGSLTAHPPPLHPGVAEIIKATAHTNPFTAATPLLSPNNPFAPPFADRWQAARKEAEEAGDLQMLASFPVFYDRGRIPTWNPMHYPVMKDIKKAAEEYGVAAPFTIGLIQSLFTAYVLTPHDIRVVFGGILKELQMSMWENEWRREITKLVETDFRNSGIPMSQLVDSFLGLGQFMEPQIQAQFPQHHLNTGRNLAFQAFKTVGEATRTTPCFVKIVQEPGESFTKFAERLREAVNRQIESKTSQDELFNKLIIENANADCQRILRTLKDPTIMDMIKACKDVGTTVFNQTVAEESLARVFTQSHQEAARTGVEALLSAMGDNCFRCHKPGHLARNCPLTLQYSLPTELCPRCRKGYHWAKQCRSVYDVDGRLLSPRTSPRSSPKFPKPPAQGNGG